MVLATAACSRTSETPSNLGTAGTDDIVVHEVSQDETGIEESNDSRPGLHGTVRNNDGSPAPGANILIDCKQEPCPAIPDIGVLSDAAGQFHWQLPDGVFDVSARTDDKSSDPIRVTIRMGERPHIELTLVDASR